MTNRLILAAAGAGKTHLIITESVQAVRAGKKVLVVTYTEANQRELIARFEVQEPRLRANFIVKGLFTFLLEDFVRPYQKCFFLDRVDNIYFNSSDPHKRGNRTIPGRTELLQNGCANPAYYLSGGEGRAHTTYLAKLATKISEECGFKTVGRLSAIYDLIYIDEIQDLVGWDYAIMQAICTNSSLKIACVGDFRQTIYNSSVANKLPKTSSQKRTRFGLMGFESEQLNRNRRSIQAICDFADKVHESEGFDPTVSLIESVPDEFVNHHGVVVIKRSDLDSYLNAYSPVVLRQAVNATTFIENSNVDKINFGKSKGLGFDRVLILPTAKYLQFLKTGNCVFDSDRTEESKNKLYVAITRARYSVAFLVDDSDISDIDLPIWCIDD